MILEYFNNIDNNTFFLYIVISIIILYIFTNVIKIEIGHLLALIISIIVIIYITDLKNNNVTDFNTDMEFKLKSLTIDESNSIPEYFHLDADLINLFYDIKQNISIYNSVSYTDALNTTNNILKIRNDMEQQICNIPIPPNPLDNNSFDYTEDTSCNSNLINSYENYQIAEEQVNKCMNYLQSLIISIPSEIVIHTTYQFLLKRAHILLKRNLDIIKDLHNKKSNKNINSNTRFITDYDLPKAINTKNNLEYF